VERRKKIKGKSLNVALTTFVGEDGSTTLYFLAEKKRRGGKEEARTPNKFLSGYNREGAGSRGRHVETGYVRLV